MLVLMQVQSLPLQQKVARSGHCSASLPSHDGEESAIICSTFGMEEFAYQRELLTVNKAIDCEELVK